jgi:hypothetical protein
MNLRHLPLFFASAAFGFAGLRLIPVAQACIALLDTGTTFEASFQSVTETSTTGADGPTEAATWPAATSVDLADHSLTFSDGTSLVFE